MNKPFLKNKKLDPRIKFLMLISTSVLSFLAPDWRFLLCLYLPGLIFYLISGYKGQALRLSFVFSVLMMMQYWVLKISSPSAFAMILGVMLFFGMRLFPICMIFYWMIESTTISEWMKSMEKCHLPKGFIITTATLMRYAPTIRYEFFYIKNSMKMRGIGLTFQNCMKRPLMMLQYSITPLLLRSVKIADDLSASAVTRGIENDVKRNSYYNVRICQTDWLVLILYILFLTISWFLLAYQGGIL